MIKIKQGYNTYKFDANEVMPFMLKPSKKGAPHTLHLSGDKTDAPINYNSLLKQNASFSFRNKKDAQKVWDAIINARKKPLLNYRITLESINEAENINQLKGIKSFINFIKAIKNVVKNSPFLQYYT